MIATKQREYRTGNFALTTVLKTLGYRWHDPAQECAHVFPEGQKPERDARGKFKRLGRVTFLLERGTDAFPAADLPDVLAAYDGDITPGDDLDQLLDGEGTVEKRRVRELLPLAYAECARNALANLREVRDTPNRCQAMITVRKPRGGFVIIPENADEEMQERWGVKFKQEARA